MVSNKSFNDVQLQEKSKNFTFQFGRLTTTRRELQGSVNISRIKSSVFFCYTIFNIVIINEFEA